MGCLPFTKPLQQKKKKKNKEKTREVRKGRREKDDLPLYRLGLKGKDTKEKNSPL